MKRWRPLVTIGLLVVAGALWLANWSRPQPSGAQGTGVVTGASVSEVRVVEPRAEGGPYQVEATIDPGAVSGPRGVTFHLVNKRSGEVIQTGGQVNLQPGTVLVAVVQIQAPRADYEARVDVEGSSR